MSKYNIYSIKDVKMGFMTPIYQKNDAVAIRDLSNVVNDKTNKSFISENYEDVELYKLGEFDEETGEIIPEVKFIIAARDCKKGE